MIPNYLSSIRKQFEYYILLGEKAFEQLTEEELFFQSNLESNSITVIVKHMWGNMRSRWTEFLTTDGEKNYRNRESEFNNDIDSRDELIEKWNEGWEILFTALDSINASNINQLVYIRNHGHTIIEAINRQLSHYTYYVGQIVYIGKMIKGKDWKSLPIPKGESSNFNANKFSKPKPRSHITDDTYTSD